jgi:hypothetical protein
MMQRARRTSSKCTPRRRRRRRGAGGNHRLSPHSRLRKNVAHSTLIGQRPTHQILLGYMSSKPLSSFAMSASPNLAIHSSNKAFVAPRANVVVRRKCGKKCKQKVVTDQSHEPSATAHSNGKQISVPCTENDSRLCYTSTAARPFRTISRTVEAEKCGQTKDAQ